MLLKSLGIGFAGLLLVTLVASAATPTLEGIVKDMAGHPVKGADVRIEGKNGSKFSRIVKTDATGHYTAEGLVAGDYKVTLLVNGTIKASILNARTQSSKPTQLNFELTQKTGPSKTHMVWMSAETGTHIGNGRWIEVDEQGRVVNGAGAGVSSVEKVGAAAIISNRSNRARSLSGN